MPPKSTPSSASTAEERLALRSRLSDISLVPGWIEHLASQHDIPEATQFAINLCLEEILSNVIRHGYRGDPNHSMAIRFASAQPGQFVLVVEDAAAPFNPLAAPELPPPASLDDARVGGQGIRLVRRFADAVAYEPMPAGNRMTLTFRA
jgi:anti-sigma regulatory factor (Ser/Thr protein kinase)